MLYRKFSDQKTQRKILIIILICAIIICLLAVTFLATQEAKSSNAFYEESDTGTNGQTKEKLPPMNTQIKTRQSRLGEAEETIITDVSGYHLSQPEPSQQDIEKLGEINKLRDFSSLQPEEQNEDRITYQHETIERYDSSLGFDVFDKSVFRKYVNDETAWSLEISEFCIMNYERYNENVLIYGQIPTWSNQQEDHAWIAWVDDDGNLLWKQMLQNGFTYETVDAVVIDDSKITVFSRGELTYLCMTQYDHSGTLLQSKTTEIGNYGIWRAARLGDGYVVQIGSFINDEYAMIVKIDKNGDLIKTYSYEGDDCYLYITDMMQYNDEMYLSAYAVPVNKEAAKFTGNRAEISTILNYIFEQNNGHISNAELTQLVRDNYTAMLLVCDGKSLLPVRYYTVDSSVGANLTKSTKGMLTWDVEDITQTYFSPATSSFTIGGASYVYRYSFRRDNSLVKQEKTGEVVKFRR